MGLNNSKITFLYTTVFFAVCTIIFLLIIFIRPIVGVADQGDFSRVFFGITWPHPNFWESKHFFRFVTPDYKFIPFPHEKLYFSPPEVSQIYFVYLGRVASRIVGLGHFSQYVYAVTTGLFYILGLSLVYTALLPKKSMSRVLLGAGLIFMFVDGRWVQWFNSLYGEPIVMIGMLLTIGLFLMINKYSEKGIPIWLMVTLAISQVIMIGGKLQAISLIITVLIMSGFLAFTIWKKDPSWRLKLIILCALTVFQFYYCYGVYNSVGSKTNKDTLYQSVFQGLLLHADDPAKVIDEWGLDPEFINDVGKGAYNPDSFYTFGSIKSKNMQEKFFDKVTYGTVIKYYLTHPSDLTKGLQYLGSKSLQVPNSGIHPREYYVEVYEKTGKSTFAIVEHGRFTLWTNFRGGFLPKSFLFLTLFLAAVTAISVILFRRKQRTFAVLMWSLMTGGCIQFVMPYIFNGTNDTAKQLMIFVFIFDLLFFGCILFLIHEIGKFFQNNP